MKPHMKKELTERDIKNLMTPRERPVPPADLAERIKQEIPADLPMLSSLAEDTKDNSSVGMSNSRIWLMAASVILAVGGGFLAFRLMEQIPAPGESSTVAVHAGVVEQEVAPTRGSDDYAEPISKIEAAAEVPIAEVSAIEAPVDTPAETTAEVETQRFARERQSTTPSAAPAQETASSSRRLGDEGAASSDFDSVLAEQEILIPPPPPPPSPPPSPPPAVESVLAAPESGLFANGVPSSDIPKPRAVAPPPRPRPASPGRGAPVQPVGRSREQKKTASRDEELHVLADAGDAAGNARITSEYAGISGVEEQTRELEAQLKALEQVVAAAPSTGGTAEPNDAPYGDVFFESAGTNPFIDTEDDALSTFGLDVDTGSYTVARRYLRDGHLPPHESVRVEEFINYFDYGDASPDKEEFNLHAEGAPSIYGEGERYYLLRFNLSGRELHRADRRPALLTFVIDVSGSMQRENRLGLVKQALALLIGQLRADDRLALVVYGSRGQVVLQPTSDHGAIRRAIEGLQTGGSTNAEEGLEVAYELAARHRRRGAINRVILCSDGVANVGATSAGSILDRIRREANQGIELTTVGFGMGNYNDVMMEQLADTGNGRYAYVDTLDEARRIFVENLTGTLQTLAAEARAQVEFSPEIVTRYRLLGYENRDIADERFRDDTVDAGEIGVGHKVTALYEIKTARELRRGDRVGVLRLRYGSVDRGKMVEVERAVTGADFVRRWEAASSALKLTSLVAEYAEILKHSYWAREGDLDDVFRRAQRLSAEWEGDREVADFISLVGRAAEYQQREEPAR